MDRAFREGQGNLKAIPTLKSEFPRKMEADWKNRVARQLRRIDHSVLNLIARPSWSVWSDRQIPSFIGPMYEFFQGLGASPAAGTTNGLHVKSGQNL